jgi:hypothetical protein
MPNALVTGGSSGSASRSHACSTRRGTAIAGEIAAPGLAVHGATKAAVIHLLGPETRPGGHRRVVERLGAESA